MHLLVADIEGGTVPSLASALGRLRPMRVETLHGAAAANASADLLDGFDAALLVAGEAAVGLARRLRRQGVHLPLILLADDKAQLAEAFAAGVDDHLVRPVWPVELLCRLDAVIRRRFGFAEPFVACGDLVVHLGGEAPTFRGRAIDLEPRLARTLACLARQAGRVVARDTLHAALYPDQPDVGIDVIKVHICRLRRRLGEAGVDRGVIETVADVGYRLRGGRLTPASRSLAVTPGDRAA